MHTSVYAFQLWKKQNYDLRAPQLSKNPLVCWREFLFCSLHNMFSCFVFVQWHVLPILSTGYFCYCYSADSAVNGLKPRPT